MELISGSYPHDFDYSIDYNSEALSVMDNTDLTNHDSVLYGLDDLDFSGLDSSWACLRHEAQLIVNNVLQSITSSVIASLAEEVHNTTSCAETLGFTGSLGFSSNYLLGYCAHESESLEGVAIYRGAYQVESELDGVEHVIANGLCASACWTAEA
ncbi:hypothetical protein CXF85_19800 [Colwellia sp. 75C3]|uniref:hypothetical protein n=1 Tax=Colwellia sp. 75C3 TaxID=888425 RepID=UPI000C3410D6|nr:hypothetical protein [Colwellia sp. 75C3]PKG81010.1 hypothetical protein CXF85_19800 [Colwellia sp. 75C3]